MMSHAVHIQFDCLPLRSFSRLDVPVDAPQEDQEMIARLRAALAKHGSHNAYYLCNGQCVFRLTNHEQIGTVAFRFEGAALTGPDDMKTRSVDLRVELEGEVCDWLSAAAVDWLAETVRQAVRIEFDRYIAAGDLERTKRRVEQIEADSIAGGGFLGMGL